MTKLLGLPMFASTSQGGPHRGLTLFDAVMGTYRQERGQGMSHHFKREEEAVDLFLGLFRQKRASGYKPAGLTSAKTVPANRRCSDTARRETPAGARQQVSVQIGAIWTA
ncbi:MULTISPECIES: WGR domain-containing protein [unclassified Rhizobium]|uniref:WGR domain-containing protein n=2 Tax=Rhizobium TaxID=379 RepID=UPI0035A8E28C